MEQQRFSQLPKVDKLLSVCQENLEYPIDKYNYLMSFWHPNPGIQQKFDELSENTISNYYFPYSIAKDFLINDKLYTIPMAIEESSVVAAACKSAKFWLNHGGMKTRILGVTKIGHIHFLWHAETKLLQEKFDSILSRLHQLIEPIVVNMVHRGGGILRMHLEHNEPYHQLKIYFNTVDSMGANFINTVLEAVSKFLSLEFSPQFESIFSIVSNYTPECVVEVSACAPLAQIPNGRKMLMAYEIAHQDTYRAVTHNKGIMNGIDAVAIATGNDFRAIEACAHAYAAKEGKYKSLSSMRIDEESQMAHFSLTLPLAVGTVGGIGRIHGLANISLEMLGNPSAPELMSIMASVGLAQNFAAVSSLVTTGIQKGHMKMHLINILHQLGATNKEAQLCKDHFLNETVSYARVREFLASLRNLQ